MTDKTDALLALDKATRIADKSKKIDREKVVGRAVIEHLTAVRQALAAPADCVGCEGTPAEGNNPCAVCGRGDPPAASAEDYERELSAVMPEDFKDWHQNDKREWPAVAAAVIRNLRDREAMAWEQAASVDAHRIRRLTADMRATKGVWVSADKALAFYANAFDALTDSAGGAKGGLTDKAIMAAWRAMADELEADPDTECGAMRARQLRDCARELQSREELFGTSTPQPAEGDGAVIGYVRRAPFHTRDIWKDCTKEDYEFILRHGYWTDSKDGFNWPSIARPIYDTRPAATAVAPEGLAWRIAEAHRLIGIDPKYLHEHGAGWIKSWAEEIAAAPAAPKGVDDAMVERACQHWYAQWDKAGPATRRVWAKTMRDLLTAALATGEQS